MKFLKWMLVFAWMGVIFFLSHQPADTSGALSGGLLEKIFLIIGFFERMFNFTFDREILHFFLRKGAHFTAYFILGALLMIALANNNRDMRKVFYQGLLIAVIYAITDEFHQTFIPGRAGQVQDVLIDTAGAATALTLGRFHFARFIHRVDKC